LHTQGCDQPPCATAALCMLRIHRAAARNRPPPARNQATEIASGNFRVYITPAARDFAPQNRGSLPPVRGASRRAPWVAREFCIRFIRLWCLPESPNLPAAEQGLVRN
jgi:hypothetical protein